MGGIETVKIIKRMMQDRIIKKVYVIANTGFSDLETKEKAYDAGIDYFMTKPLNIMSFRSIASKIFPRGWIKLIILINLYIYKYILLQMKAIPFLTKILNILLSWDN